MQLKRFFARDNHSALKMVREEIGPDAIIISNRKTDSGVEVIATADYDENAIMQAAEGDVPLQTQTANEIKIESEPVDTNADMQQVAATTQQQTTTPSQSPNFADTLSDVKETSAIEDMRNELNNLRTALDSQIASIQIGQWGQQSKARAELFEKLTQIGLGVELITQLISATDVTDGLEKASRKVLLELKKRIRVTEHDAIERGGIVVLHGPTGAGKTTTIAKLAAQFLRDNEPRDLVLVCADNARVGAFEQLQTFGKLLGVSVIRIRHAGELNNTLTVLENKKLILVDSAGMVQADLRNPQQMLGMNSNSDNVYHYLVMAATMQRSAMERILDSMSSSHISGVILTKFDEAVHLGDMVTSLLRHELPLTSWTDGQDIANDLHRADAAVLVSKAMHLNKTAIESKDDRILLSMMQSHREAADLWH